MRILIVDDEPMMVEVLRAGLRHAGHEVVEAGTWTEALPMLPYVDAVICDGLEGKCWDVLDRATLLAVPCVLLTGDGELVDRARSEGIAALLKPASIAALLAALTTPAGAVIR